MDKKPFSEDLSAWLYSGRPKTIDSLIEAFREKSFALAFMLLLFPSSLPLPTGGITNVFELLAIFLALELIVGRRSIWLPKKLRAIRLNLLARKKSADFIVKRVKSIERFSHPRADMILRSRLFEPLFGLVVIVFTLGAFFSPPFAGLDTLPGLGVVVVSLAVIFEDGALFIAGLLIGIAGIALELALGASIVQAFKSLF